MLVLSRHKNEAITIGSGPTAIRIVIVDVRHRVGEVRIGIDAPKDVLILREELVETPSRPRRCEGEAHGGPGCDMT